MAVFSRSTQRKTRVLRSSRTAHERQKPYCKQKSSSRDVCSNPSNNVQKNICTHISAKKVLPNRKKTLRNTILKKLNLSRNDTHSKINKLKHIEPVVKEEFKISKQVKMEKLKTTTCQDDTPDTLIRNESKSQIEKNSGKTIKNLESMPPFIDCGISNESLCELRKTTDVKNSVSCVKKKCLRSSFKRKTFDKQLCIDPKSTHQDSCSLVGNESPSKLIKSRTPNNIEVHEANYLNTCTFSKKEHPQGLKEIYTKELKMARYIDRDVRILTRNRNYHKFKETPYEENLKKSKSSSQDIRYRSESDLQNYVYTNCSTEIAPELKEDSPEKILKSSRRKSLRSDTFNTVTENKSVCQKKFTIIKEIPAEEKKVTRSTCQNINMRNKNYPTSKIQETPTRTKSRSTEFISQKVCFPILGESSHELIKATDIKRFKMSKSPNPNKITRRKTADKLKEIPFHKTTTFLKSSGKAVHAHFTCEIEENLSEVRFEKNIKEYESMNSDFRTAIHPHFKKECPEGSQDFPQKTKLKTKKSYDIHTRSRSESFHQFIGCFSQIEESQTSKLTVAESTRTKSKYDSDAKCASKMITFESSYEKNVSSAKESPNSKLTVTESTGPTIRRSNSKSKYPLVVKSTSKVSMKTSESVCSNDLVTSESSDNSSETGNVSVLTDRKQVQIDRSILKEELLDALKRSVENIASQEPQPSSSSETTPVFEVPSGEKLKELEMSIRCAVEKAIANVDLADCQNFMLEIDYFNLTFFVAMVFNQCGEENAN